MKLSREIIKIDIKKSWIVSLSWRTFIFLFTFFLCNLILGKTLTSYFVVENIKLTKLISIRLFQTTMKLHLFFEWLVMSFEMNFHVLKLIIFNYFSVIVFHQPFAGWEVSDFSVNTILFFLSVPGKYCSSSKYWPSLRGWCDDRGQYTLFYKQPFFQLRLSVA